ncbi:MAG: RNA methyltransferase [Deltaproteobacteria bacterium]|jgi:tRNA/rRNA methyltransferase|nr:RNA methyltransferase [Deltaproteobacteria bacterium]
MPAVINSKNVSVILCRPRYPENIGAAARAMCNMGFDQLLVVDPQNCDLTRILKMATHAASDVVEQMQVYENLQTALAPLNYVVATTARLGGQRQSVISADRLASELAPITANNRVGLVFGPEDRGLTNEDLRLCHRLVTIPTAQFSSLNLAQAVMIICYELWRDRSSESKPFVPRLANRQELDGMYAQLKDVLVKISYIQPDNPDYFMNNLRQFGTRMRLRAKEVTIIRGICRQINWYGKKCFQDGMKKRGDDPCD